MADRALKDILYSHFHRQRSALSLGGILLLGLGGISACNSTPLSPTASPSPLQTTTPSTSPTMAVQPIATASPALVPTATPYVSPTSKPFPPYFPMPTPSVYSPTKTGLTPESCAAVYQAELDWVSRNDILQGYIFDDNAQLMEDVRVTAEFNNYSFSYYSEQKTQRGYYQFPCAAAGARVNLTAQKPGYTSRSRVEIIKANRGQPNYNRYDFGRDANPFTEDFSASYEGLSDQPEVTLVTPARNGTGLSPITDFILQFSEPMDRQSVEDAFTVRSFKNHKLSVDNTMNKFPSEQGFKYTLNGKDANTHFGSPHFYEISNGTPIYDSSAFNFTWNADDTQVIFQFKPGLSLPTDKIPEFTPHYQVAFKHFTNENRTLRDKTGVERKEKHFKLTDGDFEDAYQFQVKADQQMPSLKEARWVGFSGQTPTLLLQYSEPMLLKTYSLNLAGGMADELPSCKQAPAGFSGAQLCTAIKAAENYQIKVTGPDGRVGYQGPWSRLGGEASYASWDASYRTIVLSSKSIHPAFVTGAQVEITANPDIVDPAGNPLSNSQTPLKVLIP